MKLTPEFLSRPAYTLTVRELIDILRFVHQENKPETKNDRIELCGMQALADFLKVSKTTAQKIKNSGQIPFEQLGRKVMFDGNKVLEALEKQKPKDT